MRSFGLLIAAVLVAGAAPATTYRVAGTIAAPGDGGWDYARVDPATRRLFVARSDSVTIVDLATGTARSTATLNRGHAVLPIPGTPTVLVTSGNDNTVRLLDVDGAEKARIRVGRKPDAAIWDDRIKRALVMNADDGTVSVIDVGTARVERTIAVKPALEYAALSKDGTLFVNDEDANEIEVVDLRAGRTTGAIPLPGCEGPTGLAYDTRTDRLISACANGRAAIIDAARRHMMTTVAIGRGPDAVILDERRRLAFIPCGHDGVLEVLTLDGPAGVRKIATLQTELGARTGALDPTSGTIYLPTAKLDPPSTPGGRPVARPGTFHILTVRPS